MPYKEFLELFFDYFHLCSCSFMFTQSCDVSSVTCFYARGPWCNFHPSVYSLAFFLCICLTYAIGWRYYETTQTSSLNCIRPYLFKYLKKKHNLKTQSLLLFFGAGLQLTFPLITHDITIADILQQLIAKLCG